MNNAVQRYLDPPPFRLQTSILFPLPPLNLILDLASGGLRFEARGLREEA
jgi:hypothetical protein